MRRRQGGPRRRPSRAPGEAYVLRGLQSPVDGLTPRYLGAGTGAQVLGRQSGLQGAEEALQGEPGHRGVGGGGRVAVLPAAQLVRVHGPKGAARGGAEPERTLGT